MKKYILLMIPVIAALSFSYIKEAGFTIKGKVQGGAEIKKVYLLYADITTGNKPIDSAVLDNGTFTFKGTLSSPRFLQVQFVNESKPYQSKGFGLFAENSNINIDLIYDSLRNSYEISDGSTSLSAKVTGSRSNDEYLRYYARKSLLDAQRSDIFMKEYIPYLNPGKGKEKGPREIGMDACKRMDKLSEERKEYVLDYVLKNKPSEVLSFIATQGVGLSNINTGEIDRMVNRFAPVKEKGLLTANFIEKAALAKKTAVGSKLLDFKMQDADGKEHSLSEYVGKGRYVLLEFWASWCGPCRADIPHLKESFDAYHDKGFDVVGISLDDKKENWLKAIGEEKIGEKWPQLSDLNAFKGELTKQYRINGIPACLLFDPKGNLVTRNMRGSWMDLILIDKYGDHFAKK